MSDNQTENIENPVSKIELAAWAVVSEPVNEAAIGRVKENAKRLALEESLESDVHVREQAPEPKSVHDEKRGSTKISYWLIRGGIAAVIAGIIFATVLMPNRDSAAFAAALKKLDLVKVFSFDQTIHMNDLSIPGENHVTVCEDGRSRSEIAGTVMVMDETGVPRITLIGLTGTAILQPAVEGAERFDQLAWFKELKRIDDETTRGLGHKEIDGVLTFGKEVVINEYRFHIWVDVKAEELVLVEHFFPEDSPIEKTVVHNFNFDEEADESLFSFEVPRGYKVHDPKGDIMRYVLDPELNITDLMRAHANLANGKFPRSLGEWKDWLELLSIDGKVNTELAQTLGALKPFLASLRTKNFAYLGDGVSLDQKERVIVFWYKNKEGQFRAIYSDLTAEDINESDLPK